MVAYDWLIISSLKKVRGPRSNGWRHPNAWTIIYCNGSKGAKGSCHCLCFDGVSRRKGIGTWSNAISKRSSTEVGSGKSCLAGSDGGWRYGWIWWIRRYGNRYGVSFLVCATHDVLQLSVKSLYWLQGVCAMVKENGKMGHLIELTLLLLGQYGKCRWKKTNRYEELFG